MGGKRIDIERRTPTRMRRALIGGLAAVCALVPVLGAGEGPAGGAPRDASLSIVPAVGGGGRPVIVSSFFDLASVGYSEAEFIVSGTAKAYTAATPLSTDGKWAAEPSGETAPFTTRAVLYRPSDPARFNGTVVVEWLNVSGGLDAAPDWTFVHTEIIRRGYAYMAVSAQAVGLNATKGGDPERYEALSHPGDSFSYDMYTQIGRAVRAPSSALLGGLRARRVIAIGESQSAFRLVTYINAIHPLEGVYDGFLVHSRFGNGAALSQAPLPAIGTPTPSRIRDDLDEPVLVFESETDIALSNLDARQDDSAKIRVWEVAGTSHADMYSLGQGWLDPGDGRAGALLMAGLRNPQTEPIPGVIVCERPINAGPQHYVLKTALRHLDRWVRGGPAPAHSPRLEVATTNPVTFVLDADGNAKGGIRTPPLDAPIAALSGIGQSGAGFCRLFGTTEAFDDARLAQRYPSRRAWITAWRASAVAAREAGFLLAPDAREIVDAAKQSDVLR